MKIQVEAYRNREGDLLVRPVSTIYARKYAEHMRDMTGTPSFEAFFGADTAAQAEILSKFPQQARERLEQGWPVRFKVEAWTFGHWLGYDAHEVSLDGLALGGDVIPLFGKKRPPLTYMIQKTTVQLSKDDPEGASLYRHHAVVICAPLYISPGGDDDALVLGSKAGFSTQEQAQKETEALAKVAMSRVLHRYPKAVFKMRTREPITERRLQALSAATSVDWV